MFKTIQIHFTIRQEGKDLKIKQVKNIKIQIILIEIIEILDIIKGIPIGKLLI